MQPTSSRRPIICEREGFEITSTELKLILYSYLTCGTTIRRKINQPKVVNFKLLYFDLASDSKAIICQMAGTVDAITTD